jgi:hypothetical protein
MEAPEKLDRAVLAEVVNDMPREALESRRYSVAETLEDIKARIAKIGVATAGHGKAVQIDPVKPTSKPPGTKRLKLKCDRLLSILPQFCFQNQIAPLQHGGAALMPAYDDASIGMAAAAGQGLTLVHFSAQRKRFLWNKGAIRGYQGVVQGVLEVIFLAEFKRFLLNSGCNQGLSMGCSGSTVGYYGVFRVYFVSETAQVELNSGRV